MIGDYLSLFLTNEQIIYLKKRKAIFEKIPIHFLNSNSIFIHIPKAAGMSVVKALYNIDRSNHDTWLEYYKRDRIFFENSFKFTFVRDPADRFISAYEYLINGGKTDLDVYWKNKYLVKYSDLSDFILNGGIEKAVNGGLEHFIPQYKFIYDNKLNLKVDYVGKFEDIQHDFNRVAKELRVDRELIKTNHNPNKKTIKLGQIEQEKINTFYSQDIILFNY